MKKLVLNLILKIVLFFSLGFYKYFLDKFFMEEKEYIEPKWMSVLRGLILPNKSTPENLDNSTNKSQEVKMVKELPTFKGYTVDERLKQFRKVDKTKPSIDFVDFDSEEGQQLLEEYNNH